MVTDFIYNDCRLSDFGYAIVLFDTIKDGEIDTDSQLTFNHISIANGKKMPFITSTYEDPLKMEFYIARNLCNYNDYNGIYDMTTNISLSEMAFLKRWLVSPTPHKLQVVGDEYAGIFWMGSFNVEEYTLGDNRIGAHLTFECDAPFGYYNDVTLEGSLNSGEVYKYNCISDEIGYLYPNISIRLMENGDLELSNSFDGKVTSIKNCRQYETITMDENMQIYSDYPTHEIMDDFNFVFYRIGSDFGNIGNTLESNLAIEYTIQYRPICKAVIV